MLLNALCWVRLQGNHYEPTSFLVLQYSSRALLWIPESILIPGWAGWEVQNRVTRNLGCTDISYKALNVHYYFRVRLSTGKCSSFLMSQTKKKVILLNFLTVICSRCSLSSWQCLCTCWTVICFDWDDLTVWCNDIVIMLYDEAFFL